MRLKYLIRDFKWVITPAAYILLMIIISLIFIMKNSNHDLIADKQDIIDGVSFGSKIEIDKINKPSEAENEILNQLINIELLILNNLHLRILIILRESMELIKMEKWY
jgi:hypothetical protein